MSFLSLITVCRWQTNGQRKCSHSFWLAELSPTKYLHKVSADLCLFLLVSFVSTWTQLSKLTIVLNTRTTIGFAANNAVDLNQHIRAVFKCIRAAGLQLALEKCHFGIKQIVLLGGTISPEGISTQAGKFQNFPDKLRFPESKMALQCYLGYGNYYKKYVPRMAEMLHPFYNLLKSEVPININSEQKKTFDSLNKALSDACEPSLKQRIPGKQVVLMTHTSCSSAGYILKIRESQGQKIQSKRKIYAPLVFDSKTLSNAQLKMFIYSWELSAIYLVFLEFAHFLGETTKTDNRPHRQQMGHTIFANQSKSTSIVERMWICFAIPFQISKHHWLSQHCSQIFVQTGSQSHGEDTPQIREDIQTTPIDVTTCSSDRADEEQFFFTLANNENESENQTLNRKKTISTRCETMGSEWGTILIEN